MTMQASPERVLVVKLGALGDLILADGALRDIREHHPAARITLLTRSSYVALMRRCPWVDDVIGDDNAPRWRIGRMLALHHNLQAGEFDIVYDLQNSRRTRFYRRWLSSRRCPWSITDSGVPRMGPVPSRHAEQLRHAGVEVANSLVPRPTWIADDMVEFLRCRGIEWPFVALLPGSSLRHPEKRWPHFRECAQRLEDAGLTVTTIPGIDEPTIADDFSGHVLKIDGRPLNLHQLAGTLRLAACVVGNDSGPTHLAACLDVECVALFEAGTAAIESTGIRNRNTTSLTGKPIGAIKADAVVTAIMARMQHVRG